MYSRKGSRAVRPSGKLERILRSSFGEEVLRRADLDDLAVGHEHHAIGDLAGEAHLVGHDHHRHRVVIQLLHDVETS
jgi:hypothetical protein